MPDSAAHPSPHVAAPLVAAEAVALRLVERLQAGISAAVSAAQSAASAGAAADGAVGAGTASAVEDWPDIRATLGGDGDAFARLVRKYQATISQQMWRFSRKQNDCEELTHEVFVEAYLSLRHYRGDAPLVHWLRRIATRVGYRYYKRQASRRAEPVLAIQDWDSSGLASREAGGEELAETAEAAATVHQLLAKLPPRDRLVLTLIYLEECSMAEAAELTGWSQTMVKVQTHRARKKLKKLCETELQDLP